MQVALHEKTKSRGIGPRQQTACRCRTWLHIVERCLGVPRFFPPQQRVSGVGSPHGSDLSPKWAPEQIRIM